MRFVETRAQAITLAQEEIAYLASIKNDPAKTQHFLNTLQAEKLIYELITMRSTTK